MKSKKKRPKMEKLNKCEPESSDNFFHLFGFHLSDLGSVQKFTLLLFRPTDAASLAIVRILFGMLMFLDIPEERGLAVADIRWGDPLECRFPFFHFLRVPPLQWMFMVYLVMWLGALGITFGVLFRTSCAAFASSYWYILLLDKSAWNNHSYLYGLLALLLLPSQANLCWSLDAYLWPSSKKKEAPLWNYTVLRFQLFLLYFVAGLKKFDLDWLHAYSMTHLANHWLFEPFRVFMSSEQVDLWIIHIGGFLLDLTIAFWLFFDKTRPLALFFCASFHLMNSQIFSIGMFPYVCLATLPLFCNPSWPRQFFSSKLLTPKNKVKKSSAQESPYENSCLMPIYANDKSNTTWKHYLVVASLASYATIQTVLPYSHSITKGYNNWTHGLYGYSWDMMVHSWNTILISPRIVDNLSGKELFLDAEAWVQSDRWSKHADMVYQWSTCIQTNLKKTQRLSDVSVFLDVWSSLNGRFQQRMYDPRVDLTKAQWSPFQKPLWTLPLLTELSEWRLKLPEIESQIFSWSNYSDVLFVADFPGLTMENFIASGIGNVSLTVLNGEVEFEQNTRDSDSKVVSKTILAAGESTKVAEEAFHHIKTISTHPSCYMYTFINQTALINKENIEDFVPNSGENMPGFSETIVLRVKNIHTSAKLIWNAILHLAFGIPVPRRVKLL